MTEVLDPAQGFGTRESHFISAPLYEKSLKAQGTLLPEAHPLPLLDHPPRIPCPDGATYFWDLCWLFPQACPLGGNSCIMSWGGVWLQLLSVLLVTYRYVGDQERGRVVPEIEREGGEPRICSLCATNENLKSEPGFSASGS